MPVEAFGRFFDPIRKSVTIAGDPARAFAIFTAQMERWWPLAVYSVSRERAVRCGIEPRRGGEVFEIRDDGERCVWGRVLEWAPPGRLVLSWHPGLPSGEAQELEVRFTAVPGGTRVDLEHRGWHQLGDRAPRIRNQYDGGWTAVLEAFVGYASATGEVTR